MNEADEFVDQPALLTALLRMFSGCGQVAFEWLWLIRANRLDCQRIDSNKVESVNSEYIELNVAHDSSP